MPSDNRLIKESSPYLQQHAHNPVDWYPWGEEAFEKARLEDKPLFVSIGYSSCHWCHVMEEESFENDDVAALMNESFINIKVDREERPDIDSYYMNAVQMITGKGGWPLNVFTLSDGRPFFGGTYFPRENFMKLLPLVADQYDMNRAELIRSAESIEKGTEDYRFKLLNSREMSYDLPALNSALKGMQSRLDEVWGGIAGAPKFPMPVLYRFLLAFSHLQDDPDILNIVLLTLDKMAGGGIYDQVGGGFARYSTDKEWKVPHFEKMLYDNAQLVSLYADAYKLTGKARYKEVILNSLGFIEREMTSPEGVFYSALDADSQGQEGLYYIWREKELRQLLSEDYDFAARVFRIGEEGLWERGENILLMPQSEEFTDSELSRLERIRETLLTARSERVPPGLDDKSLTSWNSLMIAAYIDAYEALGEASYLVKAGKAADFILENFVGSDGGLYHVYKDGTAYIDGFLEDYAQLAAALISLYEVSAEKKYLDVALGVVERSRKDFYSSDEKIFYAATEGNELLARDVELTDIILPSSNATMAHNLFRLGSLTGNSSYRDLAEVLTGRISSRVLDNPLYFSHWAELMLYQKGAFYEVVTVGPEAEMLNHQIMAAYLPHTVRAYSSVPVESDMLFRGRYSDGSTGIFICRDNSCTLPVFSVSEALKQLDGRIP